MQGNIVFQQMHMRWSTELPVFSSTSFSTLSNLFLFLPAIPHVILFSLANLTTSHTAILPVKPVAPNIITPNLLPSLAIADSSENRNVCTQHLTAYYQSHKLMGGMSKQFKLIISSIICTHQTLFG